MSELNNVYSIAFVWIALAFIASRRPRQRTSGKSQMERHRRACAPDFQTRRPPSPATTKRSASEAELERETGLTVPSTKPYVEFSYRLG
jgi:hypothetical protein